MSRIFVSHSSKDNAFALALAEWLGEAGWDDIFLDLDPVRGITAGERWERALHEAANRCEAVIFLVSRAWLDSDWCLREFHLAAKLNKRMFGVLIEEIAIEQLPGELTGAWQLVSLAAGTDHRQFRVTLPSGEEAHVTISTFGLTRLRAGLHKAGLDPRFFTWPPDKDPERSPYRGMRALEADDAGIFFGREAAVIEVLDRLRGLREAAPPRLLAILGASGAGKSSFLRAGLLPRLERDDRNFLTLPVIRPGRAALSGDAGLVAALHAACGRQNLPYNRAAIRSMVETGVVLPLLSELAATATLPGEGDAGTSMPTVVLAVDQGEELFSTTDEPARLEAEKFLTLMRSLVLEPAPGSIMLLTIRSDAYEALQGAPALDGIHQATFSLPPLPKGAYKSVIEGPARRLEGSPRAFVIEPRLTDALLSDIEVGGARDALPLLAFTLERLWLEKTGSRLALDDYRGIGGILGSIEAAVKQAFTAMDADSAVPRDREARLALLRRALIPWLAGIDPDTNTPRRRVANLDDIPQEARSLITHLVAQRLLLSDRSEDGHQTLEPAHEALLRQWGLLQGWLEEDAAALLVLEGVKRARGEWEANARDEAWLAHQSGRLEDAERFTALDRFAGFLTRPDRDYLQAAREADTRRRDKELQEARRLVEAQRKIAQRTRIGAIAATLLAVLAIGAGIYGFHQAGIAREQTKIAQGQSDRADAAAKEATRQAEEANRQKAESDRQAEAAREQQEKAEANAQEATLNETISLDALSRTALLEGRPVDAVQLALAAWPRKGNTNRPTLRRTIQSLAGSLGLMRERLRLRGHVISASFSPDGGRILTTPWDHTARVWDAATGVLLLTLTGHDGIVNSAAFSPDGSKIVTASADKTARVWDATTGTLLVTLAGHEDSVLSASFSPDGKRIVTASLDKTARIWDAATGALLLTLTDNDSIVHSAAFSPDGRRIVAASGKIAHVWDADTGALLLTLTGHENFVVSASFSPDGGRIVTTSWDKTARIWDAATGAELLTLAGHGGQVNSAIFSPDGSRIVTASDDRLAGVWDAATGGVLLTLTGHEDKVLSAAFSPDGSEIVTASEDDTTRIWDVSTSKVLLTINDPKGIVNSAAFSPDGTRIVTGSAGYVAHIWDTATGAMLVTLIGHGSHVVSASFSPDGKRVVTASKDKTARVWDAATGALLLTLTGHKGPLNSAAFSPDGNRIVTASWDKTVRVWDAATGVLLLTLPGPKNILNSAAFSSDSGRIVTASGYWDARIWDAATGASLMTFAGHSDVTSSTFSPDGNRIVTTSEDKTVRVWDAATGAVLVTLTGHEGKVYSAAFSPDGRRIVTASEDKTVRVWDVSDLEVGDGFAIACQRLGNDTSLDEVRRRYHLGKLAPICGDDAPVPVDMSQLQ